MSVPLGVSRVQEETQQQRCYTPSSPASFRPEHSAMRKADTEPTAVQSSIVSNLPHCDFAMVLIDRVCLRALSLI